MNDTRDENLQILRFVAAALVLITHITFYIHERINTGVEIWHGGEGGVPIFFVISGFVMYLSGEKLPRNAIGAKTFISRRIARIFPLYWLITTLKIAIAIIVPAAVLHNKPDILSAFGSYLLIPMLNDVGEVRPIHGVAWTLLHEMLFYYVFTVSILLRQSPYICGSIVICSLWLIGLFVPAESAIARVCFSNINLMFVAGMVLASLFKQNYRLPFGFAISFLILGVATLVTDGLGYLRSLVFGDFHIEVICIVAALLSIKISAFPMLKGLFVKLGDSSYSLYMIHPVLAPAVCLILSRLNINSVYFVLPLTFFSCVTIAHFVYRFVESPLNRKARSFLDKNLLSISSREVLIKDLK